MMHPPEKTYRGGEGVVRIVTARDGSGKQGGDQKYWCVASQLDSAHGRCSEYLILSLASPVPPSHAMHHPVHDQPQGPCSCFGYVAHIQGTAPHGQLCVISPACQRCTLQGMEPAGSCLTRMPHSRHRSTTLFSLTGRALPWTQWLLYILYTSTIVLPVVTMVPGYGNISLLKALQLPINVLGAWLARLWCQACQCRASCIRPRSQPAMHLRCC
jgi:hypothetical protein